MALNERLENHVRYTRAVTLYLEKTCALPSISDTVIFVFNSIYIRHTPNHKRPPTVNVRYISCVHSLPHINSRRWAHKKHFNYHRTRKICCAFNSRMKKILLYYRYRRKKTSFTTDNFYKFVF